MTLQPEQDVYEPEPTLNIYEALGVSPDVSPIVAQTMYWARISELRREEEAGDLEARRRISELNTALQIILDKERRAEYDRLGVIVRPDDGEPIAAPAGHSELRKAAWQAALAIIPGAAAGLLTLVLTGEPFIAVIVAAAPVLAAALLATTRAIEDLDPLEVLELAPDAGPDQVDLAYRTLVSVWLSRVGSQPDEAVQYLERLDRAYPKALERALEIGGIEGFMPAQQDAGPLRWFVGVLGAAARQTGRGVFAVVRKGASISVRPVAGRASGRMRGALDRGAELTTKASQGVSSTAVRARDRAADELTAIEEAEADADASPTIDLERRLRASIHAVAEQAAEEAAEPEEESEPPRFWLVLESAVGSRRISVDDHPVRIGSSENADIMVDATQADGAADALIWVNAGELVLHNAPGGLNCTVNGEPVTWARLDAADLINIAGTAFRIEDASPGGGAG